MIREKKILTKEELENVTGGAAMQAQKICCKKCGKPFYANILKTEIKCKYCGEINTFDG